jgi:DNA polymerase
MADASRHPPRPLRELLHFYADAGVDEALFEEAPNRFEEGGAEGMDRTPRDPGRLPSPPPQVTGNAPGQARPTRGFAATTPSGGRETATVPDGAQVARAREIAREAGTLEELRTQLAAFDGCNLKFTAKSLCFADGNPQADLMLVGEAPGREEDLQGLPFVGRSGRLLDRMLAAIGRDRTSAYIANTVPWRPPGNREPTPLETEICRPFIERQIELAAPKVLVAVGGPSAKFLLNTTTGIMRLRGKWHEHVTASGRRVPTMPTLHPAYLLRNPAAKRLAWRDFLEVKARLAGEPA